MFTNGNFNFKVISTLLSNDKDINNTWLLFEWQMILNQLGVKIIWQTSRRLTIGQVK